MGSSVLARNSSIHPTMPKPHPTAVRMAEVAKMSVEPLLRSSERTAVATNQTLARQAMMPSPIPRVSQPRRGREGPNPGKWTRGFNQDAIVSVADSAASKAFGER